MCDPAGLCQCFNSVSNSMGFVLGGIAATVHEQNVKVSGVVDEESAVSIGSKMTGLLVGAIANLCSKPSACYSKTSNVDPIQPAPVSLFLSFLSLRSSADGVVVVVPLAWQLVP
jgi:hypothetical protein